MKVKLKVTYNAGKLVRKLPNIIEKLSSDMLDRAKVFYIKNTEKGKDIFGDDFEELKPTTLEMRKGGLGTYKSPITHDKPLIASRNMIQSINKAKKKTLYITGYGVFHNRKRKKAKQRRWFGMSEYVLENILDNRKLKTFRKQISRALKK